MNFILVVISVSAAVLLLYVFLFSKAVEKCVNNTLDSSNRLKIKENDE